MKKILFAASLIVSITGYSQTTIYSENFESAGHSFTLNTTDMSSTASGNNVWLVNNSFTGGTGSLTCLGFPFAFSVLNVNSQPVGITNSPSSKYMHITSQEAINDGIFCASYLPSDGTCFFDENSFSKMSADVATTGMTGINLNFWWVCGGSSTAYGEVYYSLNGGTNWMLVQSNLNNSSIWTQASLTNPLWDNQTTLRFGFRFENTTAASAADPGFGIDEIIITNNCSFTYSTINETACDSYTSPSGNYTWTNSNTYMDTIPNTANCDSIITINLTITNSSSSTITETACDSYTSPSGNYTWTSSNTYIDTVPNAANCDSIITINLTINNSSTSTITETACDSYNSPSGNYIWTSSNTYIDTIPNATNCDSIITINLIINSVDSSVTQSGKVLTANETGATYQWLDCLGMTLISGATNQSYTATANGDYAVVITKNGCTDTSACYTVNSVGIMVNDFGNKLLLYPNPTDGNFSIDLGKNYQSITVTMTDLGGKVILSKTYNDSQLLNLKLEEPAGIYLLNIESVNNKALIRLIKK